MPTITREELFERVKAQRGPLYECLRWDIPTLHFPTRHPDEKGFPVDVRRAIISVATALGFEIVEEAPSGAAALSGELPGVSQAQPDLLALMEWAGKEAEKGAEIIYVRIGRGC